MRRSFCAALAALLAAGCAPGGTPPTPTIIAPIPLPTASATPVTGRWLITREGNLFIFDLQTRQATPLSHFPPGTFASSPALSPDRRRIAYSYYVLPKDQNDLGGSDLYIMGVDGNGSQLVHKHDQPGTSYEEPCWTPDAKALLATRRTTVYAQGKYQGVKVEIVRVPLDGSDPVSLIANAQSPSLAPDGQHLAYVPVNTDGVTNTLWLADADGKNSQQLLADAKFTYLRAPHVSPDSQRIVFGAVGGSSLTAPTSRPGERALATIFGPAVAEAHGIPYEIWTVAIDGSDPRRLTHLQEDTPYPIWSPNGDWIACAGEIGLYLIDPTGKQTLRLSTQTSGGGLAWL
ncbi:MAG TPA: hypothetical protein VKX96_08050 [Chloroflexota bacterium]|nr:hypothetical protein [Chloroflexota bacterium]